jgi:hypothetical protein
MLRAAAFRPEAAARLRLRALPGARRALASEAGAVAKTVGTEAVPAAAPAAGAAGVAAPKKGGLRQSAAWFLAGCGLSLGLGYLQLSRDIEQHTRGVEASLAELRRDTLDSQKVLRKRVAELEAKR